MTHTISTNTVEVAIILSSRDMVTALPRYDIHQISNFIQSGISWFLPIHRSSTYVYYENELYYSLNSTKTLVDSDQSCIPGVSPGPTARTHK